MGLIIYICLIGTIVASLPNSSASVVVGSNRMVTEAVERMDNALVSYSKAFGQCASIKNFHKMLENFSRSHRTAYSDVSGELVGELVTSLLNADNHCFETTQSIYAWCGTSVPLLEAYIELFEDYNQDNADGQKELLTDVLNGAVKRMRDASIKLEQIFSSFDTASNKLSDLILQLSIDYSEDSDYFKGKRQVQLSVANDVASTQVLARNLQHLGKSQPEMDAEMMENLYSSLDASQKTRSQSDIDTEQFVAKLKAEFVKIISFYEDLRQKMSEVGNMDRVSIFTGLQHKIQLIENSKIRISESAASGQQNQFQSINIAINGISNRCKTYRMKYGNV